MDNKKSIILSIAKAICIPLIIWYGLVLYYAPRAIMGWPTNSRLPDSAIVVSYKIIDPVFNPEEAGIYLWVIPREKEKSLSLNPKDIVKIVTTGIPRAYKIPFSMADKEKMLTEGKKIGRGSVLTFNRMKKGEGSTGSETRGHLDDIRFKRIDMHEVLPK